MRPGYLTTTRLSTLYDCTRGDGGRTQFHKRRFLLSVPYACVLPFRLATSPGYHVRISSHPRHEGKPCRVCYYPAIKRDKTPQLWKKQKCRLKRNRLFAVSLPPSSTTPFHTRCKRPNPVVMQAKPSSSSKLIDDTLKNARRCSSSVLSTFYTLQHSTHHRLIAHSRTVWSRPSADIRQSTTKKQNEQRGSRRFPNHFDGFDACMWSAMTATPGRL